jgi:hypothetical protein
MRSLILASLAATCVATAASAQTIGGTYAVKGTNPNGAAYTGTVQITMAGTDCKISWQTGSTTSAGVCARSNRAFSAVYQLGNAWGFVVYELQPDGTLTGVWRSTDQSATGTETLTPKR